jgi:hypothetical protein
MYSLYSIPYLYAVPHLFPFFPPLPFPIFPLLLFPIFLTYSSIPTAPHLPVFPLSPPHLFPLLINFSLSSLCSSPAPKAPHLFLLFPLLLTYSSLPSVLMYSFSSLCSSPSLSLPSTLTYGISSFPSGHHLFPIYSLI